MAEHHCNFKKVLQSWSLIKPEKDIDWLKLGFLGKPREKYVSAEMTK